jgi:glycosyltransferase involved in cell wall biosynthesis
MTIGIVIPAYNAAETLDATLGSVFQQDPRPARVLVVDDGSSDDTAAIASRWSGVRLIRQENRGAGAARNVAFSPDTAGIDGILWLDADDVLLPGALAAHLAALSAHPQADAAWGMCEICHPAGAAAQDHPFFRQGGNRRLIQLGSMLWRRDALERLGPMDERWRSGQDHEYLFRARRMGLRIQLHDHVGLRYFRRPGSLSFGRLPDSRKLAALLTGRSPDALQAPATPTPDQAPRSILDG